MTTQKSILDRIKHGNDSDPPSILLAGPEGIGKSTFASKAPNPLFICPESGLRGLDHVNQFVPTNLDDIHALLDQLLVEPSGYKTVVIDTADWLERMIYVSICQRDGKKNIEDYGYGKGYVVAESELVRILQKLDTIRQRQKLFVILLSHVQIRTFNDPRGESWDRYEMKGNKKMTGILREWPDACLFAVFEVFKTKADGKSKTIGGDRMIHTEWSPAWDAKNRLGLPESLPLEWDDFETALNANSTGALRVKVRQLYSTAKIPEADKPRWEKWMPKVDGASADTIKSAITKLETLQ